jgi:hypothetical protein
MSLKKAMARPQSEHYRPSRNPVSLSSRSLPPHTTPAQGDATSTRGNRVNVTAPGCHDARGRREPFNDSGRQIPQATRRGPRQMN